MRTLAQLKADAKYRTRHHDRVKKSAAEWLSRNREKHNRRCSAFKKANSYLYASYKAKYRAKVVAATPPWLSKQHRSIIVLFYKAAAELAKIDNRLYEVDHVVPISGSEVCGLHVPWNLQVLSKSDNRRKSNRLF